ncbi:hypothetical protein [Neobacillus soli]|nr:hypothetical protein [Neobacillus soli]
MTSVNAAKDYLNKVEAPLKDFVVFDQSAHYPQFEEKEQFADWLNKTWAVLENNERLSYRLGYMG